MIIVCLTCNITLPHRRGSRPDGTRLYSVYYMYMYCSYFIIQGWSLLHKAAVYNKVTIVDLILQHGGDANLQDGVSDYILIVIHM